MTTTHSWPALGGAALCAAAAALCVPPAGAQTWSSSQLTVTAFDKQYAQLVLDATRGKIHYAWQEWDGGNWQIWTGESNPDGSLFNATQRTSALTYSMKPQLALDEPAGIIHYVFESSITSPGYQIWTAKLDLGTMTWTAVQRTLVTDYKWYPQLALDRTRNVVHYVYQQQTATGWEIWTASLDLGSDTWTAVQRTSTATENQYPRLALDETNNVLHYAWEENDLGGNYFVWTATYDVGADTWSAARRTDAAVWSQTPALALDSGAGMLKYVYRQSDPPNFQIATAEMNTDGTGWASAVRTSASALSSDPELAIDTHANVIRYAFEEYFIGLEHRLMTADLDPGSDTWTDAQRTTAPSSFFQPQLAVDGLAHTVHYVYQVTDGGGNNQLYHASLRYDADTPTPTATATPTGTPTPTPSGTATPTGTPTPTPSGTATPTGTPTPTPSGTATPTDTPTPTPSGTATPTGTPTPTPSGTATPTGTPTPTPSGTATPTDTPTPTPSGTATPTGTPTPTPSGTVTPIPTPTPAEGDVVVVANGGTAAAPGRTLSVVDDATWAVARTIDLSYGGDVGRMPKDFIIADDTIYVVCHDSHRVWYGPLSGPMEGYIDVGRYPLGIAALSRPGLAVVTCTGDDPYAARSGSVSVVDLAAKKRIAELPAGRMPNYGIAVSPGRVAVSALLDDAIWVYDGATGRVVRTIATGRNSLPLGLEEALVGGRLYWGAALFGDGRTDAAAAYDEGWGRRVLREGLAEGVDGGGPVSLACSSSGLLAVALFMGNRVRFYDVAGRRLVSSVRLAQPGMGEFSSDGRFYYSPCFVGELCRVDTSDFSVRAVPVGPNPVRARFHAGAARARDAAPAMGTAPSSPKKAKPGALRDFLGLR